MKTCKTGSICDTQTSLPKPRAQSSIPAGAIVDAGLESEREFVSDPLFECLDAPKGDELVRFATEGGEHAREVGG